MADDDDLSYEMDAASRPKKKKRQVAVMDILSSDGDNSVEAYSVHDDDDDSCSDESSIFKELWEDEVETEVATYIDQSQSSETPKDGMCTQPSAAPKAAAAASIQNVRRTPGGVPKVVVPIKGLAQTPESLAMSSSTQPTSLRASAITDADAHQWMHRVSKNSTSPHADSTKRVHSESPPTKNPPKSTDSVAAIPKPAKVSLSPRMAKVPPPVMSLEAVGTATATKLKSTGESIASKTKKKSQTSKSSSTKEKGTSKKKNTSGSGGNTRKDEELATGTTPKHAGTAKSSGDKVETTKRSLEKPDKQKSEVISKGKKRKQGDSSTEAKPVSSSRAPPDGVARRDGESKNETAAPQAPRRKKRSFQDQVLLHMLLECKPFTLKTLAKSLNTAETALNFVMLSLVDKNLVIKKEFSTKKTTKELYWANQDSTAKEIKALQTSADDIKGATEELRMLERQDAELAKGLATMNQELSNEEIRSQLKESEESVAGLKHRLQGMHDRIKVHGRVAAVANKGPANNKSAALLARERCPRRMKMRINVMRGEWKKRKEKCTDFVDQLADGMEKKVKDIVKLLDLETDEMEGVTMPAKHETE